MWPREMGRTQRSRRRVFPPHRGDGARGVSLWWQARARVVNAGAAASQRPARPSQRPLMRAYRRAPPGYQLALPLYRPARRSMSWLGSAFFFGLKLLASGLAGVLAGVLVATALWHESWKPASSPQAAGNETAAHSSAGETTVYRRPPAQRDGGSWVGSRLHGRLGPGAAVELSAVGEDDDVCAAGAGRDRQTIPPGRTHAPGGFDLRQLA